MNLKKQMQLLVSIRNRDFRQAQKRWSSLRAELLREFTILRRARTVRSAYGPKFVANVGDATFWFYILGSYGRFYWDHIAAMDKPFVMLDIGANQGLYTICAAKNPRARRVYAFEPMPEAFAFLEQNLRLNKVAQRCEALQLAISDQSGLRQMAVPAGHSGAASMRPGSEGEQQDIVAIDGEGLSALVREREECRSSRR